jgi:hypothetical protein
MISLTFLLMISYKRNLLELLPHIDTEKTIKRMYHKMTHVTAIGKLCK